MTWPTDPDEMSPPPPVVPATTPAEIERDALAHREGVMRTALDRALLVILDRVGADDPDYGPFVAALVAARPDLTRPAEVALDRCPADVPSAERLPLLAEALDRLAGVLEELGEPGRCDYVASLRSTNGWLLAEYRKMKDLTRADPAVLRRLAEGMEVRHWAVRLLAGAIQADLDAAGAQNFLVIGLTPAGRPPLELTIQVKGGTTPMERIGQLEAEVAELRQQLAARADERTGERAVETLGVAER